MRMLAAAAATGLVLYAASAHAGSAWDAPYDATRSARTWEEGAARSRAAVGYTVEGPLVDGQVVPRTAYRGLPDASYGFGYDGYGRPSVVVSREPVTRLDPDGRGYEPVLEADPSYLPRPFEYVPARRLVLPGSLADGTILPANVFLRDGSGGYGYDYGRERTVTVDTRSSTVVRILD